MMNHKLVSTLIVAITLLQASFLTYAAAEAPEKTKRGWWWGEKTPPSEVKPDEEYKELPPPPPQADLMDMHPRKIEKILKEYFDQAVWRPTPEHVRDYYLVQDVVRKKALAYTAVTGLVMQQSPYLDVSAEYPSAVPGRDAATRMRKESLVGKLSQYRNDFALLFFTSKSCQWCEVQRGATVYFTERHGWKIKEIDIADQPAAAARFGVEVTPFLVMIDRSSDKWMPVAVGVRSLPDLEEATYRSARLMKGEITPDQFYTMDYQQGGAFDPSKVRR